MMQRMCWRWQKVLKSESTVTGQRQPGGAAELARAAGFVSRGPCEPLLWWPNAAGAGDEFPCRRVTNGKIGGCAWHGTVFRSSGCMRNPLWGTPLRHREGQVPHTREG